MHIQTCICFMATRTATTNSVYCVLLFADFPVTTLRPPYWIDFLCYCGLSQCLCPQMSPGVIKWTQEQGKQGRGREGRRGAVLRLYLSVCSPAASLLRTMKGALCTHTRQLYSQSWGWIIKRGRDRERGEREAECIESEKEVQGERGREGEESWDRK